MKQMSEKLYEEKRDMMYENMANFVEEGVCDVKKIIYVQDRKNLAFFAKHLARRQEKVMFVNVDFKTETISEAKTIMNELIEHLITIKSMFPTLKILLTDTPDSLHIFKILKQKPSSNFLFRLYHFDELDYLSQNLSIFKHGVESETMPDLNDLMKFTN